MFFGIIEFLSWYTGIIMCITIKCYISACISNYSPQWNLTIPVWMHDLCMHAFQKSMHDLKRAVSFASVISKFCLGFFKVLPQFGCPGFIKVLPRFWLPSSFQSFASFFVASVLSKFCLGFGCLGFFKVFLFLPQFYLDNFTALPR